MRARRVSYVCKSCLAARSQPAGGACRILTSESWKYLGRSFSRSAHVSMAGVALSECEFGAGFRNFETLVVVLVFSLFGLFMATLFRRTAVTERDDKPRRRKWHKRKPSQAELDELYGANPPGLMTPDLWHWLQRDYHSAGLKLIPTQDVTGPSMTPEERRRVNSVLACHLDARGV